MNSKAGRFFYLAISFILGAFFLFVGFFSLILPWSTFLQAQAIHLISEQTLLLSLFGLGLILIGLSILAYAILRSKRQYASIRTGSYAVSIDEELIQHYLEQYWKEHFPKDYIPSHLTIKKDAIYIVADLPPLPKAEQQLFLNRVRKDFHYIFSQLLGYPHEVHVTASFQTYSS